MHTPFRIIDSGVRDGRLVVAFDQALIQRHRAGLSPDTIHFVRVPSAVLVGRHQAIWPVVKMEDCLADGVQLVRRITGGGAIFLDEQQVGWELVLSRSRLPLPTLADYTRAICEAVAQGLSSAFGIAAQFRPRNDIEVEGRKLCGTGGFFDGDTLIYQGTVLLDIDPAHMMRYLNVPEAKLKVRDLDKAESRITTLKALTGQTPTVAAVHAALIAGFNRGLGIDGVVSAIDPEEERLALALHDAEIGRDEFVFSIEEPDGADVRHASISGTGGTVSAYIRTEGSGAGERFSEVLLTGDFFVTPPRTVLDLEASLRGTQVGEAGRTIEAFFARNRPEMLSMAPADFARVVRWAVAGVKSVEVMQRP